MLTSINAKFIFDSARLGLFSSANVLQIADVTFRVVFLLFLPYFQLSFRLVLTLEMSEMSAIFVFTTKTTQPRPHVFSVNSASTGMKAALLTPSVHLSQNSSKFGHQQLVMVNYVCAFSQSELGKYRSAHIIRGRECMIFGIPRTKQTVHNREVSVKEVRLYLLITLTKYLTVKFRK